MSRRILRVALVALPLLLTACAASPEPSSPPRDTNSDPRGVAWTLARLHGAPPHPGTSVTATFGTDGRLSGSAGCNRYSADYSLHGDTLTIAAPAVGAMACAAPEVMAQEETYLTALTEVRSYRARHDGLELKDASGAVLASFSITSQDLADSTWAVTGYHTGTDAVRSPLEGTAPGLSFTAETLHADAGCNPMKGSASFGDGKITVGSLASGRKMCAPAVMEQERALGAALQRATGYAIQGDVLRLSDGAITLVTAQRR